MDACFECFECSFQVRSNLFGFGVYKKRSSCTLLLLTGHWLTEHPPRAVVEPTSAAASSTATAATYRKSSGVCQPPCVSLGDTSLLPPPPSSYLHPHVLKERALEQCRYKCGSATWFTKATLAKSINMYQGLKGAHELELELNAVSWTLTKSRHKLRLDFRSFLFLKFDKH